MTGKTLRQMYVRYIQTRNIVVKELHYQDAALLLAADKKFTESGFPDFMNVDPYLLVNLE